MGFFSTPKPTIDKRELTKIINELYTSGNFNEKERALVDVALRPYLDPSTYDQNPGVDQQEVGEVIASLRNPDASQMQVFGFKLSEEKVKYLEERLNYYLQR